MWPKYLNLIQRTYIGVTSWPSMRSKLSDIGQVLFSVWLRTERQLKSITTQQKNEAKNQPSWLNKLWSIEHWLYGTTAFLLQDTAPRQESTILPIQVASHNTEFGSSYLLTCTCNFTESWNAFQHKQKEVRFIYVTLRLTSGEYSQLCYDAQYLTCVPREAQPH